MKRGLVVLAVVGFVVAGVANASVQQGDTELDLLAGFEALNGNKADNVDSLFIESRLGYFLTDNVQAGGIFAAAWTETDTVAGDEEIDTYSVGGFVKYHFMPTNQWVPYVGAQVLWSFVDIDFPDPADDDEFDGIEYGPLVGMRYELNAYNDFFVEYRYTLFCNDFDDLYDESHGLFLGIIHQFK